MTPVPAAPGLPVPLSAFTDEVRTGQKVMIFRHDKERAILFGGNERPGHAAGTVGDQLQALADDNGITGEKPLYFFLERYMESFSTEMIAFVDAVENDKPVPVGIEAGLNSVRIALAAKQSVAEHRPVTL